MKNVETCSMTEKDKKERKAKNSNKAEKEEAPEYTHVIKSGDKKDKD